MKCQKCGFVFNDDVESCPYCGNTVDSKNSVKFLRRHISFGKNAEVTIRSIFFLVLFNLALIGVIAEIIIGFDKNYHISLYSFIASFGLMTLISVIAKPRNLMSSFERIDWYFLVSLALFSWLIFDHDLRAITLTYVIPLYLVLSTIVQTIFLLKEKNRIRPIRYTFGAIVRWVFILVLFIFILIPTDFMAVEVVKHINAEGIEIIDAINVPSIARYSVIGSFGVCSLFLFNFIIVLTIRIIAALTRRYETRRR